MLDIQQLYEETKTGKKIDKNECLDYLKSFNKVIIWGAGNLGQALGSYLKGQNISIASYWDVRCDTVKDCIGIPTTLPFSQMDDKAGVVVILAITNAFVKPNLLKQIRENQVNYLEGEYLYQGLVCPQSEEDFKVYRCNHRKECNVAVCQRMMNLMYAEHKKSDKLFINSLDVYVTQKCTLQCKYCYIYTNSYPKEKRILFKTQRILEDIDRITDAASYIKRMVPFGGEPFLHPDLDVIVERMASKSNIGIIDIISNGIFNYPVEKLEKLKYPNVRIDISNYNMSLDQRLIDIRNNNCKLLVELGLNVTVHNETPSWRKPGTFDCNGLEDMELDNKKKNCANFMYEDEKVESGETYVIKNGRFFPCQHCDTIYNLDIDSDTSDHVVLDDAQTTEELIKSVHRLVNKKHYSACKYCNPSIDVVSKAGEQGIDEMYKC